MHSRDVHEWRAYFKSSKSSIFDVIENSILVAALDHPYEFNFQKEQIAFKLLTSSLIKCSLCEGEMSSSSRSLASASASAKESRVNCSNNSLDVEEKQGAVEDHLNRMLENLAMEIEEDDETLQETLKVKKVLGNSHAQSDLVIEELLRKLHQAELSIQILKATMIGSTVTTLRKHGSKQIREQARDLIWKWRKVADEWIEAQDTKLCELPEPREQEQHLNIDPVEIGSRELRYTHPNNNHSNGEGPTIPECTPANLSKLFEGVDEKTFFSILPNDDTFATMEALYIEQDPSERLKTTEKEKEVKLLNTQKRTQPNQATDVEKRKASKCDKKGKSVAAAQNQLKQKTIEKPTSDNTQKKAMKHEIGALGKPQVGSALKANEGRKVDQKPLISSSYARQVVLALPSKRYEGTRKPKSNPNKRAKVSQSAAIHQQATMEDHQMKVERARKRLIAGYEKFENGKKRRAVKVIDPEELKDLKGKQGKKNLSIRV